jgi:hypothetical protein
MEMPIQLLNLRASNPYGGRTKWRFWQPSIFETSFVGFGVKSVDPDTEFGYTQFTGSGL